MVARDATLRRPRTLFLLALVTLAVSFFFFYERIKATTASLFQEPLILDTPPLSTPADDLYQGIFDNIDSMSYGTAHRPPMKGLPKNIITDLPDELVPAVSSHDTGHAKRLIIIGDVHGHKDGLQDLLDTLHFDSTNDTLIFTGDLINKGPDSAGVVKMAMELGAYSVRGNHEDRILLTRAAMDAKSSSTDTDKEIDSVTAAVENLYFKDNGEHVEKISAAEQKEYQDSEEESVSLSNSEKATRAVARSLSHKQVKWLSELPIVLRVGSIPRGAEDPAFENLLVVHAGLVPKVALEDQDPWAVMNMRTISYPVKELRREAVRKFLVERAKAAQRGNRGKVAALQAIDDEAVTEELEKILEAQGHKDDAETVALPSSGRDGVYWYEEWSAWQEKLVKQEKKKEKKEKKGKKGDKKHKGEEDTDPITTVVYGHDAKSGLRAPKEFGKGKKGYTFGLDSGCVYGKQLTALVIEVKNDQAVHEIVQVDCAQHWDPDTVDA